MANINLRYFLMKIFFGAQTKRQKISKEKKNTFANKYEYGTKMSLFDDF